VLENIATWKFPRNLPRCAQCQYAVTEDMLRQTCRSCCHENEI